MLQTYTLIADAGATKTDWCLKADDGSSVRQATTEGINATVDSEGKIAGALASLREKFDGAPDPQHIYFYGAGCASAESCGRVAEALAAIWPEAAIAAGSDMLGAARALLGHRPGIACILGTGSNSCLYDGNEISANIPPLGFILGDEGSGASLGKRLIGDIYKEIAPDSLRRELNDAYGLPLSEIIRRVYREQGANRFLASFVPFIKDNIANPHLRRLVFDEFDRFFTRNVLRYPEAKGLPVSFTGSVAFHFQTILRNAAVKNGCTLGEITRSPMPGLIRFHSFPSTQQFPPQ